MALQAARRWFTSYGHYAALALILLIIGSIRYRLRDFPLERDEGEYAYMGQLILQGIPPYDLAYNMKLPGTYVAYAVILFVFGSTPGAIHSGFLALNASTIILVYLLGARVSGRWGGVAAAACYGLLSTGQAVLGTAAHATHFVVFFALAGLLCLLHGLEKDSGRWLLAAGLLLGTGFLMKQPGIFFVLFACLYYLLYRWRLRPRAWKKLTRGGLLLATGAALPFFLTCIAMLACGVFPKFWFWTFSYARAYGTALSLHEGWLQFSETFSKILSATAPVWFVAAFGLLVVFIDSRHRQWAAFLGPFFLLSAAAICPGLYFRPHYFILVLPAAALLTGVAVTSLTAWLHQRSPSIALLPAFALTLILAYSVYLQRNYFFEASPEQACRQTYGYSPFEESIEIAKYIKSHSAPGDRIAVLGSEPEIYFYAERRSATGYIYMYPLLEQQPYASRMQREMIAEIDRARPEFVVFVNLATSWIPQKINNERGIFSWLAEYVKKNYQRAGVVEMTGWGDQKYFWGDRARLAESPVNITLYKKARSAQPSDRR